MSAFWRFQRLCRGRQRIRQHLYRSDLRPPQSQLALLERSNPCLCREQITYPAVEWRTQALLYPQLQLLLSSASSCHYQQRWFSFVKNRLWHRESPLLKQHTWRSTYRRLALTTSSRSAFPLQLCFHSTSDLWYKCVEGQCCLQRFE